MMTPHPCSIRVMTEWDGHCDAAAVTMNMGQGGDRGRRRGGAVGGLILLLFEVGRGG